MIDENAKGPVRVLYVESSQDGTVGGSHMSLLHLVTGMKAIGYQPIVAFGSAHGLMDRFHRLGIKMIVLPQRTHLDNAVAVTRPFIRVCNFLLGQLFRLRSLYRYCSILKSENIQLVHLNNSHTDFAWLLAAKFRRLPCVAHERGLGIKLSAGGRFIAKYFDAIICISAAVRNEFVSQGFSERNLHMIHNGLDIAAFCVSRNAQDIRQEFGIANHRPIVGIVGNIQSWKGQDVVIRAVASVRRKFPDVMCLIVGDVSKFAHDIAYHQLLIDLVCEHSLQSNVILTGYRSDVASYMNAMDIVIHASIDPEAFGRVLLEAMALSKPLVASRAGGVPEIVEHGITGLLYTPGNSVELAEIIEQLLSESARRVALGSAAFLRVKSEFNIEKNTARTEEIYRSVLSGTG